VFTPVLAKHSKSFSLIDCISVAVDRMQRNFEPMRKQVDAWQRSELTDVAAKVVIYEAFVEGRLELPNIWPGPCMISTSNRYALQSVTALMQSVLLRGAAQRIKHLSRFLAERSLIFETTLHRIIVRPEWCFQRE
jgi:hypothetical protein